MTNRPDELQYDPVEKNLIDEAYQIASTAMMNKLHTIKIDSNHSGQITGLKTVKAITNRLAVMYARGLKHSPEKAFSTVKNAFEVIRKDPEKTLGECARANGIVSDKKEFECEGNNVNLDGSCTQKITLADVKCWLDKIAPMLEEGGDLHTTLSTCEGNNKLIQDSVELRHYKNARKAMDQLGIENE